MSKKIVCLDHGHGPDTVNGSPDGTYKEKEFTWDLYTRLRPLPEGQGVTVLCTRTQGTKPILSAQCKVSNDGAADLFVSIHTNAAGNGGWYDAHGLLVYTSAAGDAARRNNVCARDILARMRAAGVVLEGAGLAHQIGYTVLRDTTAPAIRRSTPPPW